LAGRQKLTEAPKTQRGGGIKLNQLSIKVSWWWPICHYKIYSQNIINCKSWRESQLYKEEENLCGMKGVQVSMRCPNIGFSYSNIKSTVHIFLNTIVCTFLITEIWQNNLKNYENELKNRKIIGHNFCFWSNFFSFSLMH
jgi:hypothetical protein